MAVNLSPVGGVAGQFFDNNGDPLVGGKLFTYAAGTTTPQVTYTSATGVTPNSNPIILNGGGRVPSEIWLTDGLEYKFVLYSSTDQLIGSWDNITGINSSLVDFVTEQEIQTATAGQTVFTLTTMQYAPGTNSLSVYVDGVNQYGPGAEFAYVETDSTTITFATGLHVGASVKFTTAQGFSTGTTQASLVAFEGFKGQTGNVQDLADDDGSNWIGFEPAGTGAVAMSVQDKLRETVSVKDFGAVGDGVTDDTAAIQAALDSGAGAVYIPAGIYSVSQLTVTDVSIFGDGARSSIISGSVGSNNVLTIAESTDFCFYEKFRIVFADSSATGYCVLLGNDTHNLSFRNLETDYGASGFRSDPADTHFMCDYTNVRVNNTSGYGFSINCASSSGTTLSFNTCYTVSCFGGFFFNSIYDLTMVSCAVDISTNDCLFLSNCKNANIISTHFESCNFGANTERLIRLASCNAVNISGVSSGSNSASVPYYVLGLFTNNKSIKFSNLDSLGNTNERFLFVDTNSTAINTDLTVSGVDLSLVSLLDGDAKIRNPDYEIVTDLQATDANGQVSVTYPTTPDYLSRRFVAYIEDGFTNYYLSSDRFTSNQNTRLRNPDGTFALVSGVFITTIFMHTRN